MTQSSRINVSRMLRSPAAKIIYGGLAGAALVAGGLHLWDRHKRSVFTKENLTDRSVMCKFSSTNNSVNGAVAASTNNMGWDGSIRKVCNAAVQNHLSLWSPFRPEYKPLAEDSSKYKVTAVNSNNQEYNLDVTPEETYSLSQGRARVNRPPIDSNLFGEKVTLPKVITPPSPSPATSATPSSGK